MAGAKRTWGKPWTTDEETQLLEEVSASTPHDDIALIHERTSGAISARLKLIATRMLANGTDATEVATVTGLSEADITKAQEYADQRAERGIVPVEKKKTAKSAGQEEVAALLREILVEMRALREMLTEKRERPQVFTPALKTAAPKTAAPKTAAPKTAAPKTAAPAPKTAAPALKTAAPAPKTAAPAPKTAAPAPKTAAPKAATPRTTAPRAAAATAVTPTVAVSETDMPE